MGASILGVVLTVVMAASVVGGLAHAFSSGEWHDWGVLQWLANIASLLVAIIPFFNVFKIGAIALMAIGGGALRLLSKLPLLGRLVAWVGDNVVFWRRMGPLFRDAIYSKGGWLYKFGNDMANFARMVGKHPWIMFGIMFASTMFDSLIRHIFQMWGDLSLKAAEFSYERLSSIMSEGGYGDPVTGATSMMDTASNSLPVCFTAIWGAVGASECIGLIIVTFQYIVLVYALSKSFAIAGVK